MSDSNENKGQGHNDDINIIVNGRPKKVNQTTISFEEVVALAFDPVPPNAFFTVNVQPRQPGRKPDRW